MAELPSPNQQNDIVLTNFIVSNDIERSVSFYTRVLGGELAMNMDGGPAVVQLANSWIIINGGGGPTDDKPEVTLEVPTDPTRTSAFLNIRVADVHAIYAKWSALGAEFLTPPTDRGSELRCYLRDPDGHLIEVGQST
jgi:catechol 2,3-dioxygenase-like lactoylglutathione lyase family enzyme